MQMRETGMLGRAIRTESTCSVISSNDYDADITAQVSGSRHGWHVLAILSTLMGFASISTDLFLPAIPAMATALRADAGTIELTISSYLIGFSLGQLLWGPISDRYGRRRPIAAGLVLFIIGSTGCALSVSAYALIGWRIVQAVGACASVVLARAMVRDLYSGTRAAQMMSTLIAVMAIAPLSGPIIGGEILAFAGWRAIFYTLVGIGLLTLASLFTLDETLPVARRSTAPLTRALTEYGQLLCHRRLLAYAGAGGFFYGGTFGYIAASPFAYITVYHVAPQLYGFLFGAGIVGIMATSTINGRLLAHFGSDRLLLWGAGVAALAAVTLAVTSRTGWGGLIGLAAPMFVFVASTGFIAANATAGALSSFPQRAGAVSALFGAIQYGGGIVGSALVGAFADGTAWPMGLVVAIGGLGTLLCVRLLPTSGPLPGQ
jgi:DHA1 family bicyclomycin/chloramphenicol resistance-like MFS transporter